MCKMKIDISNVVNIFVALAAAAFIIRIALGVLNVSSFLTFYNSSYTELSIIALLFAIVLLLIQISNKGK